MNNKILITIIVLLVGFLGYQKIKDSDSRKIVREENIENIEQIIEENNLSDEIIDVCLNIEGVQSFLPSGMIQNGDLCETDPIVVTETKIVKEIVNKPSPQPVIEPNNIEPSQINENFNYTVPSEPVRPFNDDGSLDLSKYQEVSVSDYVNNSNKYLNKPIKIKNATIASYNSYTNGSNYIRIIDNSDYSSKPKSITIEIKDNYFYSGLVDNTQEFTNLIIFGFGAEDREFTIVSSSTGSSYQDFVETVVSDSIYKCNDSCLYTYSPGVKLIFQKKK